MEYFFYAKKDSSKESIHVTKASTLEEAIEIFALGKQMKKDTFLSLFRVEVLNRN